jgi:hypothetical protein
MKVEGENMADIVRIYSLLLSLLCTSGVIAQSEFQSPFSSDFVSSESFEWNISGEQIIWGTKLHAFKIEKSIKLIPGSRIGGSWSGWEAWKRSEIWWGQEKLICVVEEDIVVYAWVDLGLQLETLPELQKRYCSITSSLGVVTTFPSGTLSFLISPDVMEIEWPWSVSWLITPPNMNGFQVGLGSNSSLYSRHWLLLVGGKVDKLEANFIVEGPDFKISCSLVFNGVFKKSITHRYGSFGGNSQWMVSW